MQDQLVVQRVPARLREFAGQGLYVLGADRVYGYDFERGLWQTGQPAMRLRFINVKATRIVQPLRVLGDEQRKFELTLKNVEITLREDQQDRPVLDLKRFGSLVLSNVRLQNDGQSPVLLARDGNKIVLDRVCWVPERDAPYIIERIDTVRTERAPPKPRQ